MDRLTGLAFVLLGTLIIAIRGRILPINRRLLMDFWGRDPIPRGVKVERRTRGMALITGASFIIFGVLFLIFGFD